MKRGDDLYCKHFKAMVLEGLVCGLNHPIEWMVNYDRCIGFSYILIPEISEFIDMVSYEMYEVVNCKAAKNKEEILLWIDEYYKS